MLDSLYIVQGLYARQMDSISTTQMNIKLIKVYLLNIKIYLLRG